MKPWIVDHLKSKPDYCLCNKSEKIDGLRKNLIKILESEW